MSSAKTRCHEFHQRQSAMMAFADAFWLLGMVYIAIIPLMILMKKTRPGAAGVPLH